MQAKVMIEAVSLFCPQCGEPLDLARNGSELLTAEDVARLGRAVRCHLCDITLTVPALVRRVGR